MKNDSFIVSFVSEEMVDSMISIEKEMKGENSEVNLELINMIKERSKQKRGKQYKLKKVEFEVLSEGPKIKDFLGELLEI